MLANISAYTVYSSASSPGILIDYTSINMQFAKWDLSLTVHSAKLQLIYGLKMSKTAFGHFHYLNLLLVHVLHVWMVATLKGGGGSQLPRWGE